MKAQVFLPGIFKFEPTFFIIRLVKPRALSLFNASLKLSPSPGLLHLYTNELLKIECRCLSDSEIISADDQSRFPVADVGAERLRRRAVVAAVDARVRVPGDPGRRRRHDPVDPRS